MNEDSEIRGNKTIQTVISEHETLYSQLFENSFDNIYILEADKDGRFRHAHVNPTYLKTSGIPKQHIIGRYVDSIEDKQKKAAFTEQIAACTYTGGHTRHLTELDLHNGRRIFQCSLSPTYHGNGQIDKIFCIARDITEVKNFERQLLDTQVKLQKALAVSEGIIHALPDLLFEINKEGKYLGVWARDEKLLTAQKDGLFGKDIRKGLLDKNIREVLSEEAAQIVLMTIEEVDKTGSSQCNSYRLELADGEHWFECHITRKKPAETYLALVRDITKRKQTEKALARRELEFRTLAENLPNPIYRYNRECRRTYVNPAVERLTGIAAKELLGKTPVEQRLVAAGYDNKGLQSIREVFETAASDTVELVFVTPDGNQLYYEHTNVPEFGTDGSVESVLSIARDITAEKQQAALLEELKESKARYQTKSDLLQSILESFPNIITFALDANYRYLAFDRQHAEIMQALWGKDIALGVSMLEIIGNHRQREVAKSNFDRALSGESFVVEQEYGDETRFRSHWEIHYAPVISPEGEIIGVTCFNLDVTKRKQNERILAETTARLSTLFDAIPDMIWLKDANGRYLTCNWVFARLLNTTPDAMIGKTDYDVFSAANADACKTSDEEAIRAGCLMFSEERVHAADGTEIILEIRKTPIYGDNGQVEAVMGIARDITQRKQMEDTIARREQEFRALAENSPDTIARFDLECRRTYVNPTFERFYGKKAEEVLGKHPSQTTPIVDRLSQAFENKLREVMRTGQKCEMEVPFIKAGEGQRVGYLRIIPEFGKDSKVISAVCIGSDITERKQMEDALARREQEFRTLAENSPNIIMRYDRNCRRTYVNQAYARQTGIPVDIAIGATPQTQWKRHLNMLTMNAEEYHKRVLRVIESGESTQFSAEWYRLSDGGYVSHDLNIIAERDGNGEIVGALAIGHDITERRQNEARLKDAHRIAKLGSWELDLVHNHLHLSNEVYMIFEIDPKDIPLTYEEFLEKMYPDYKNNIHTGYMFSIKHETPYEIVREIITPSGKTKYIKEMGETKFNSKGNPIRSTGTVQDITEQRISELQIEFMAHHDALTGLPNRILAKDRTERAIAHSKRNGLKTALLFVDLDGFKTINDSLGHSIGDMVLKSVTARLIGCVRETDTVSRLGGDEFLILLQDIANSNDVVNVINKVLKTLESPFHCKGHLFSTSASIGAAVFPDNGDNFETLLQKSDIAMYKAKEAGKNTYCFYSDNMNENLIEHLTIQSQIKSGIERGEFVLHYQPQVDMRNNQIVGVEALIRWQHPTLGMVPPGSFIPIAETSGLIVQLGDWVIREACRQAAKWHKKGMRLVVAVNISIAQFRRGNLENVVKRSLESSGLDPNFLELELTESIMMHDVEGVLSSVRNLKDIGVQLSIDDFGTGYSSLSYLKRFAVDKLKIDKSFVMNLLKNEEDAAIVQAIIQMAKSLKLKTIAEGVENKEVLDVLSGYNCDTVQGYYFAKPMKAEDFQGYYQKINVINLKIPQCAPMKRMSLLKSQQAG